MGVMVILFLSFLSVCAYVAAGMRTTQFFKYELGFKEYSDIASPTAFFAGVAWPFAWPILGVYYFPELLHKIGGVFSRPVKSLKSNEIIPGVERPSEILFGLLAQRVLQAPENIKETSKYGYPSLTWRDDTKGISISADYISDFNTLRILTCRLGDKTFEAGTKSELARAMFQAFKLKQELDKAARLALIENNALTAIEELLIPVETKSDFDATLKEKVT